MNLLEAIQMGFLEIAGHKFRSMLTMLGVIFGVAAVIAIVSIGEGARLEAMDQLKELGTNTIRIAPVREADTSQQSTMTFSIGGAGGAASSVQLEKQLSLTDTDSLKDFGDPIEGLAPEIVQTNPTTVYYIANRFNAAIVGTTPDYPTASNYRVARGRFVDDHDMSSFARVCVLGSDVKLKLFGPQDPIGKSVSFQNETWVVIGIMKSKDTSGISLVKVRDLGKDIYVPITTLARLLGRVEQPNIDELLLKIREPYDVREISDLIKTRLTRMHDGSENFEITIPEEILRKQQELQRIFSIVMGFIAGISLFVGGIGIMNIMLATVLQRTREVGIRRSIGATQGDILMQFLVEAVVISLLGGLGGILLGFVLGKGITLYAAWRTVFSIKAVILSFVVSSLVGIVFGLYPARQASRLHPVEALRYE
ncbi:MAG: ABC transporter permease [bacterium]